MNDKDPLAPMDAAKQLATLRERMANVAQYADRYDGDIAGAIRDVLAGGEDAARWDPGKPQ